MVLHTLPLVATSRDRIPALDGLRGIAMLAVVCCHLVWPNVTSAVDLVDRVLLNGWVGVDLFFVLSGFLITGILIDTRESPRYFRDFYARRALRIFPIYYLFLVALFFWIPLWSFLTARAAPWQYAQVGAHQSWYWTYTVNVLQATNGFSDWWHTGHLWSLSVEEQFYLVWPALVLFVPRKRLALLCAGVFVMAVVLRCWWVATQPRLIGAYVLTPTRADSLAAGAFVAVLARTTDGSALLRRWYRPIGIAAATVGLAVLAGTGADLQHRWTILLGYGANALAFAALIVWVLVDARPRRLLEGSTLRRIGRVSYGGYLYHLPLIGACAFIRARLMTFGEHGVAATLAAHVAWIGGMVLLTILVASISYRWIETPFLDVKERLGRSPAFGRFGRAPDSTIAA